MKRYLVKIMKRGDRVISVLDDRVAVQRKNGEVDIYRFITGDDGLPRLDLENVITITYGPGTIEIVAPRAPKKNAKAVPRRGAETTRTEADDVVTGTF